MYMYNTDTGKNACIYDKDSGSKYVTKNVIYNTDTV